jgi:hypothetical protein
VRDSHEYHSMRQLIDVHVFWCISRIVRLLENLLNQDAAKAMGNEDERSSGLDSHGKRRLIVLGGESLTLFLRSAHSAISMSRACCTILTRWTEPHIRKGSES